MGLPTRRPGRGYVDDAARIKVEAAMARRANGQRTAGVAAADVVAPPGDVAAARRVKELAERRVSEREWALFERDLKDAHDDAVDRGLKADKLREQNPNDDPLVAAAVPELRNQTIRHGGGFGGLQDLRMLSVNADITRTRKFLSLTGRGAGKEELALVVGTDNKGGFWVPDEWEQAVATEYAKTEGLSEVLEPIVVPHGRDIHMTTRTAPAVTRASTIATYIVAEQGGYRTDTEPDYGQVIVPAVKFAEKQVVSAEFLEDAAGSVPDEVGGGFGRWLADLTELCLVKGAGMTEPEGAFNGITAAQEIETATAGQVAVDDLAALAEGTGRLQGRDGRWSFLISRPVWEGLLKADNAATPGWLSYDGEGNPRAWGYPVVFGKYVDPALTAGSFPVGFGDWNSYMRFRTGPLRITMSDVGNNDTDEITFRAMIRLGSRIFDRTAARFLKVKA